MKSRFLFALVFVAALGTADCASRAPATIVTPQGQAAYTADQIIKRLRELSDAVEADTGTAPGQIRPRDAFTIVAWVSGDAHGTPPTTGLVQTIATAANDGWKVAALQAYDSYVRGAMLRYPTLAPFVAFLNAVLGAL